MVVEQDVDAGGAEVDRGGTEAGEVGQQVVVIGRGDRHHAGGLVAGREGRDDVVVVGGVAGRGDEQDAGVAGRGDRVEQALAEAAAAPRVGQHAQVDARVALGDRVVDGADGVLEGAAAAGVEELEGHDLDLPVHAGHADAVVAGRADGAGAVRAVVVVVHRIAAAGDRVEAVHVVDDAVAVVVHAVARDLGRVDPHVGGQILVRVVHAGVDHADDDVGAADAVVPRLDGVDVSVRGAAGLAGVVEPVQLGEAGIVGRGAGVDDVVALGVEDLRVLAQLLDGGVDVAVLVETHDGQLAAGEVREAVVHAVVVLVLDRALDPRQAAAQVRGAALAAEAHDDRVPGVLVLVGLGAAALAVARLVAGALRGAAASPAGEREHRCAAQDGRQPGSGSRSSSLELHVGVESLPESELARGRRARVRAEIAWKATLLQSTRTFQ